MVEIITVYKEVPARMIQFNSFKCDSCGSEFKDKYEAELCEEKCSCHHDITYELMQKREDSPSCHGIKAICIKCKKNFGTFRIPYIKDNPELLKVLWELIATHHKVPLPAVDVNPSDSKI
ncbi:MAG: hypothetical protein KAR42_15225 [candidate division Zixibacteria bacterium]|nr:hypothetical protein [candidate division Zixibacteria bacterium]